MVPIHDCAIRPRFERPWLPWLQRVDQILRCEFAISLQLGLNQAIIGVQRLESRLGIPGRHFCVTLAHAFDGDYVPCSQPVM